MIKNIKDIIEYELDFFSDIRGEIYTYWNSKSCTNVKFNHDKFIYSYQNVLRGLHGDYESTKMATCVHGSVYYAFLDVRKNSESYMKHDFYILSRENKKTLIYPPGIAAGVLTISETSVLAYKLSYPNDYPDFNQQFSLKWNDPEYGIEWPTKNVILSERDK